MKELTFSNKSSMKKWLASVTGVLLTSISIMGAIDKVEITFSKPKALAAVLEHHSGYFPEGEYLVRYTDSNDPDADQFDYSKMVMVISLEVKPNDRSVLIGGLQPLLACLAEFEFFAIIDKSNPAYITAGIWVVEPKSPPEIYKLKKILSEHSIMYAFNDGSGFVTPNNARMGMGMGINSIVHL